MAVIAIALIPAQLELFTVMQLTLFAAMAVLALSLAFIWGFGGILSFGQTAFFGLGGYAYAVAAINFQDSTPAILLAIVIPALFAAMLGYFMFFGRISDVYLGVITLTVTLILFNCVNSTSGDEYHIGTALLGGFNGMPSVPTFNMPFDPVAGAVAGAILVHDGGRAARSVPAAAPAAGAAGRPRHRRRSRERDAGVAARL